MSESASALFSIADADEFRFARFYIVCEEVPLGTPESPLIVCGLSDTLLECPNVAVCLFWNFFVSGFPVILLITPKRSMLIVAVPLNDRF